MSKAAKQAGKESGQKNNGEDCETGAVVMLSVKDFFGTCGGKLSYIRFEQVQRIRFVLCQTFRK